MRVALLTTAGMLWIAGWMEYDLKEEWGVDEAERVVGEWCTDRGEESSSRDGDGDGMETRDGIFIRQRNGRAGKDAGKVKG
jgi:hypothetical protein